MGRRPDNRVDARLYGRFVEQVPGVRILWFEEYYDGPTTGVAEREGTRYWFTPAGDRWYEAVARRYVLRRLLDADAQGLEQRMRESEALGSGDYWRKYHRESRDENGFEPYEGEALGWFEIP